MFYAYVLYSKGTDKFYKGFSSDLKNRFAEHQRGRIKATKNGIPWTLVYYEAFISETDARREELFLKSGKGRENLKLRLKDYLEGWPRG